MTEEPNSPYQPSPAGEPASGRSQSAAGWPPDGPTGPPQYGAGQPPYGTGQPPYGTGQPPYGTGQPPYGTGQPPYGTGQPPYGTGQPPYASGPPPALPRRGRPGLIVLFAVVTEVVIVAALFNQALSDHIRNFGLRHDNNVVGRAALASLTFEWRFTPRKGDTGHLWLGQTIGLVSIFVLTALLMLGVVRGPITFGRALFGTWMSVIVATGLGGIVAALIYKNHVAPPGTDRLSSGVFYGADSFGFVAGVGLGLLTGLVAGLVAVVTRRRAEPLPARAGPVPAAPGAGPGFFDEPARRPAAAPPARDETDRPSLRKDSPPEPSQSQTTAALPTVDEGGRETTQPPRFGIGGSTPSAPNVPRSGDVARDQQTTQLPRLGEQQGDQQGGQQGDQQGGQQPHHFPRPPDDEDLGHQPE